MGQWKATTVARRTTQLRGNRDMIPSASKSPSGASEINMVNYISGLVFVVLLLIGAAVVAPFAQAHPVVATIVGTAWLVADVILASAIQLAAQWQRAVVFRLGKYKEIKGPGLFLIIPLIDQIRMVDTRVLAVNIPKQQVITRDNVPVVIDGVLFFRVDQRRRGDHHGAGLSLHDRRSMPRPRSATSSAR